MAALAVLFFLLLEVSGTVAFVTPPGGFLGLRRGAAVTQCPTERGRLLALGQGRRSTRSVRKSGALRITAQDEDEEEVNPTGSSGVMGEFKAGDITLMNGEKMKNVTLVYELHGTVNEDQTNVILHPTSFCANNKDARYRIGRGEKYTLDTTENAVIVVNLLGNGVSTSPSHTGNLADWKYPTLHDNAKLFKRLLEEELGIKSPLKMIFGYSMGAMAALQFAALFPDKVKRIAAVCGCAKTTHYNRVFLKSLRAALVSDPSWSPDTEQFTKRPVSGLRTFGHIYAGWGLSPEFYRNEEFLSESLGYRSLDDFLEDYVDTFAGSEAHDILAQLFMWDNADISHNDLYKSDLGAALAAIQAEIWYIPSVSARYFAVNDIEREVKMAQDHAKSQTLNIEIRPLQTTWGHRAGDPFRKGQTQQNIMLTKVVHEFLAKGDTARV